MPRPCCHRSWRRPRHWRRRLPRTRRWRLRMSLRDDIDFEQSRAILLGTSKYTAGFEGRRPMPAALTSLAEMRRVLTGPCEWPDERITEYADERDSGNLLRKITALIGDVSDVLLFYYVGHGQP